MTVHFARPARALAPLLLTTTAIAALVIAGNAGACPLGSHDSHRVRLLHSLTQPQQHGASPRVITAQAQHQAHPQPPARNELGAYSRDLPKGAATPRSEDKPPLYDNLGRLSWTAMATSIPEARAYLDRTSSG